MNPLALQILKVGEASAMVVAKLNRLRRSLSDFARLFEVSGKEGWSIVAVDLILDTSTLTGNLVVCTMASVAQRERAVIGLRTRRSPPRKPRATTWADETAKTLPLGVASRAYPRPAASTGRSQTSSTSISSR